MKSTAKKLWKISCSEEQTTSIWYTENLASVKSITLDDVKNHYKNFFTKNNLLIGIAGSYSKEFLNKLKSDLMKLLPGTEPDSSCCPGDCKCQKE